MSKNVVVIGCRLPSGIHLELNGVKVELAGQRQTQERSPIILLSEDDYGTTIVDADFWEAWKKEFKGFAPLETGAIFEAKNESEAKAVHRELKKEKTGHEPMPQVDGKKIKSADADE